MWHLVNSFTSDKMVQEKKDKGGRPPAEWSLIEKRYPQINKERGGTRRGEKDEKYSKSKSYTKIVDLAIDTWSWLQSDNKSTKFLKSCTNQNNYQPRLRGLWVLDMKNHPTDRKLPEKTVQKACSPTPTSVIAKKVTGKGRNSKRVAPMDMENNRLGGFFQEAGSGNKHFPTQGEGPPKCLLSGISELLPLSDC